MYKLTGNAVVGQSGGPTAAINSSLAGVISGLLDCDAVKTVYGMKNGIEGFLKEDLVNLSEMFGTGREEKLRLLAQTPASAL